MLPKCSYWYFKIESDSQLFLKLKKVANILKKC